MPRIRRAAARLRPYALNIVMVAYIPLLLYADSHGGSLQRQYLLGALTLAFLIAALRFSPPSERRQVWILVGVATLLELDASLLWGAYRYRLGNVPLFVPPGHGLIYLWALRTARTPLMTKYAKSVCQLALFGATGWALAGLTLEPLLTGRFDVLGAVLWLPFAFFMTKRSGTASGRLYAAAFMVTTLLELVGTGFGNWTWASVSPYTHLSAGNPPSVIAGAYCLLDAVAGRTTRFLEGKNLRRTLALIRIPPQQAPADGALSE